MINIYLSILETDEEKTKFEKLYIKYKNRMYSIAYKILGSREDAEDSVHLTFLNIADSFKRISPLPDDELESYIIVILKNNSIDIYNRNKKDAAYLTTLDEEPGVEIDFFENMDLDRLIGAISGLPQIYKDVMFMHHLEEFSTREISKMLGISVNNVCKRLERAKKLLKKALSEE